MFCKYLDIENIENLLLRLLKPKCVIGDLGCFVSYHLELFATLSYLDCITRKVCHVYSLLPQRGRRVLYLTLFGQLLSE